MKSIQIKNRLANLFHTLSSLFYVTKKIHLLLSNTFVIRVLKKTSVIFTTRGRNINMFVLDEKQQKGTEDDLLNDFSGTCSVVSFGWSINNT